MIERRTKVLITKLIILLSAEIDGIGLRSFCSACFLYVRRNCVKLLGVEHTIVSLEIRLLKFIRLSLRHMQTLR